MDPPAPASGPRASLRPTDVVALVVGLVVGAGIFRTPSLVAAQAGSEGAFVAAWILGGLVSLAGALCYAELASAFPSPGGEYHFLARAFGPRVAFLFAWARLGVILTGSVALLAFVFGDYASRLLSLGPHSSWIYAGAMAAALTGLNLLGVKPGTRAQTLLTAAEVAGLLAIAVIGLGASRPPEAAAAPSAPAASPGWGMMMVLVLLTYGGWNDAAYASAEVRGGRRAVAWALIAGLGIVTALYLLVNLAYVRALGLPAMGRSDAVAADLLRGAVGETGARLISVLVAVSALTSANATLLLGARGGYALGRDYRLFSALGRWDVAERGPVNALLAQGAITLALIAVGALTRRGVETMVDYVSPVFWIFFVLSAASLLVLRKREPDAPRPFRVPLYPLTPLLFCGAGLYLLYASLAHTGAGALLGLGVLAAGAVVLWRSPRSFGGAPP